MRRRQKSIRLLRARSRWFGAGVLLLACVIFPAAYSPARAQKPREAKKTQALYEKALQKKSATERIQLLEQAVQLFADAQGSPFSPEIARQLANIHGALGREFYQQARWQAAIAHLEKALALDSGLLPARAALGLAYFQQGQYDAAIQAYDIVLRAQLYGRSSNAQLYNNLGAAQEAKGDLAAAVAAYSRALELDSSLGLAQKNLQRARAKLSRIAALESAFNDSVRLAAKARDSLAVATAKSLRGNSKTKAAKDKKGGVAPQNVKPSDLASQNKRATNPSRGKETATKAATAKRKDASNSTASNQATKKSSTAPAANPRASQQSALTTQRASKPSISKKEAPLKARSNKPPLLKNSARDSAVTQSQSALSPKTLHASETLISHSSQPAAALNPSSAVTEKSKSLEVSIPRAAKSPSSWAGPLTFGLSALLLAVLAVIQRRRLGHVWLQLKPSFVASTAVVSHQIRLLPARMRNELVARYERARRIKLLPGPTNGALAGPPLEAEAPEPTPVLKNEPAEPRQPSLQTQAFFAEMIAAEPEIEDFDEEVLAKSDEAVLPTNGHVDHAAAEPPLLPVVVDISKEAESPHLPLEPISSGIAKDGHNGEFAVNSTNGQAALGDQLPVISNQLPVISEQLPASSRSAADIPLQRDDQSKRSEDPASAGHQVLGRYVIERKIGKGAMGNVYLALDPKLDRRVVIKTVCFNLATSETDTLALKDRVYREARAIAKLGHPNIVVVYDVEDDKEMSYIVMEHIEGRDIRLALASEHRFEVMRAIKIVSQVCGALDYAHQAGIIHRDIKPSNIMLLPGDKAKVTDFGIAKIADNFSLTLPGHVLGTPSYMAPEQFEGMEIDGRADIFSLGVVFYELVTGCRPFAGNSLASLAYKIVHKMHLPPSLQNVELPLEIDEIVGRALAKNPEERYATAMEFREALQTLQVGAAHGEVELAH